MRRVSRLKCDGAVNKAEQRDTTLPASPPIRRRVDRPRAEPPPRHRSSLDSTTARVAAAALLWSHHAWKPTVYLHHTTPPPTCTHKSTGPLFSLQASGRRPIGNDGCVQSRCSLEPIQISSQPSLDPSLRLPNSGPSLQNGPCFHPRQHQHQLHHRKATPPRPCAAPRVGAGRPPLRRRRDCIVIRSSSRTISSRRKPEAAALSERPRPRPQPHPGHGERCEPHRGAQIARGGLWQLAGASTHTPSARQLHVQCLCPSTD